MGDGLDGGGAGGPAVVAVGATAFALAGGAAPGPCRDQVGGLGELGEQVA